MADERMAALERIFARPFSPNEYVGWAALADQGVTPELVREVYDQAKIEMRSRPAAYTLRLITNDLAPYEVKTPAEWAQLKAQQAEAAADRQRQWNKEKKPQSNVFLRRDEPAKPEGYYEHIYKKFDT